MRTLRELDRYRMEIVADFMTGNTVHSLADKYGTYPNKISQIISQYLHSRKSARMNISKYSSKEGEEDILYRQARWDELIEQMPLVIHRYYQELDKEPQSFKSLIKIC